MKPPDLAINKRLPLRFLRVWAGQSLSEIGSAMSGVAAAVHVFLETESASWLGALSAVATVPFLLVGLAGPAIDRWPKRSVMLGADAVAAAAPATALGLMAVGRFEVWHLVLVAFVSGLGNAVQMSASQAALPALVELDQLDRANSLKQIGPALGIVLGPLLATPLLVVFGLAAVLLLDLVTFAAAVVAVVITPFVDVIDDQLTAAGGDQGNDPDARWSEGWHWLRRYGHPLLKLMLVASTINFVLAWFNVSVLALATSTVGAGAAGGILAIGGGAMLVGALVSARSGLPDRRLQALEIGLALAAIGCVIAGARPSGWWLGGGVAIAMWTVPAVNAAMATIYNESVPFQLQGQVFALRGAVAQTLQPAGSLLAGIAITVVVSPSMADGGLLATTIGRFIGVGADRGPAVVLLAAGVLLGVLALMVRVFRDRLQAEKLQRTMISRPESGAPVGRRCVPGSATGGRTSR